MSTNPLHTASLRCTITGTHTFACKEDISMAKSSNQKLKILYLAKIFLQYTDESHGLTMNELIEKLAHYDISADRKTLYLDIEELRNFGMDIIGEKEGKYFLYKLLSRDFELAELKLLVDSIQSAKFMTEKKSGELIKKLESLCSVYDAKKLHRQVILTGRVKAHNESIYYNVDYIHSAISSGKQLRFLYFQWNLEKKMELRHDGEPYTVSPYALIYDDNYYLVAYDEKDEMIKHFRVDKMLKPAIIDKPRDGMEAFNQVDIASYSKSLFGMFTGDACEVTLLCKNNIAGAIIDRFGTDVTIIKADDEHFKARVTVIPGVQFFGWVAGLGGNVKIIAPDSVVEKMKKMADTLSSLYK